jgi:endonuclease YncB( thermonuclease family)
VWDYRASLVRVIDGDSLVVVMDTGFGGRQEETLRLLHVRAPELNQPGGPQARMFLLEWCDRLPLSRWPMRINTDKDSSPEPKERRTLSRYLATVSDLTATDRVLNNDVRAFLTLHPEWGPGR